MHQRRRFRTRGVVVCALVAAGLAATQLPQDQAPPAMRPPVETSPLVRPRPLEPVEPASRAAREPRPAPTPSEPVPPVEPTPEEGTWSVRPASAETWRVTWKAPGRLPVGSDRPAVVATEDLPGLPAGAEVGTTTVADDGRTVRVTVPAEEKPDPDRLDVLLSGKNLDEPEQLSPAPEVGRWTEPTRELLEADPATPGALPVVEEDYQLAGLQVPGLAEDVEMVGHVVKPAPSAESTDHPLVVFMHGRHGYCYDPARDRLTWDWPCAADQEPVPSHLGYRYAQTLLASQGYVTVSISANGVNAQDGELADGGADARSRLIRAHLDQWAEWAGDLHQVDLDRVVLVGHSRGGEGVARAALEIPLEAPYRVVGQVLLAPTDFSRQTTPYVPTVTVLPSCDGDVSDLQGQAYVDVSRDLTDDDTSLKSSVMMVGANHNFFNTEWTPRLSAAPSDDDWGSAGGACGPGADTRLGAAEQRRAGKAYLAGAVQLFTGDDTFAPMFDGSRVRVGSAGDAVVLSHALGTGRDLRRPGLDAGLTVPVDATTQLCRGQTPYDGGGRNCGRVVDSSLATPHWPGPESSAPTRRAFEMQWEQEGGRGGLSFDDPVDLSDDAWLALRTVVDTRLGDVDLRIRVTDADGASTETEPDGGTLVPALPRGPRWYEGKYWAQDVRVELGVLTGVDLSRISSVELVGASADGRVWVLDLAGVPAAPPEVPVKRIALVDLGQIRVDEGDDGPQTAEIPFTVTGTVTDPAAFRVQVSEGFEDDRRIVVDLPAGSGSGTIGWDYEGNSTDSVRRTVFALTGHALRNVMVRDDHGRLVIVDDDPAPELSFDRVERAVDEGTPATWELTLSEPVDYPLSVDLAAVPGDGSAVPVRADDIGRSWLNQWTWVRPGTNPPLHRLEVWFSKQLDPGETSLRFAIPIREDNVEEPRESISVRTRGYEIRWRSDPVTVFVRPGR